MGRCVRYTGVFLHQRTHLQTHSLQVVHICVYLYICVVVARLIRRVRGGVNRASDIIKLKGVYQSPHRVNSLSSHGSPGCNLPRAFWFTKIENFYCRFNKPTQQTLSKHAATHCNTGVLQTHWNNKSDLTESHIET